MIVCPQLPAAEAGLVVLRAGGNAVDAAVTAAFVQGVVDPHMNGIGGCGVMSVYTARTGQVEIIEFYARAGSLVTADQWEGLLERESADGYGYVLRGRVNEIGYQSVGVPGTVRGLATALERHGTIDWRRALEPAIELASTGVPVTAYMRDHWTRDVGPDFTPGLERLRVTPASEAIFLPEGRIPALGEVLDFSDLAMTLRRLAAAGADDFYRGEIAQAIAADFAANGGHITAADLAGYEAVIAEPVRGSYRDLDLFAPGPPGGGATLIQMLNFLELAGSGPADLVRAMGFAFADRDSVLGDPRFQELPVGQLLDKSYAMARHESPTTTHMCVLDEAGNAVSLTHTLGAWSGVVTPGLGFNYNDYMNCFDPRPGRPNSIAPGKTRVSMMSPTIGLSGGQLRIVVGAPGATRIVTGILQTIVNLVDRGMHPFEAVAAPRLDFQGRQIVLEGRVPHSVEAELRALGHPVVRRPANYDSYFARPQVIWIEDGVAVGASDPRGDGGVCLSLV